MILDSPTIFGMSGASLLAGGEAGAEAVVGVSSLQAMIQNAVTSQTGTVVNALSATLENVGGGGDITIPVYLGGTPLDETIITAQQTGWRSGQEADDGIYTIFKYRWHRHATSCFL